MPSSASNRRRHRLGSGPVALVAGQVPAGPDLNPHSAQPYTSKRLPCCSLCVYLWQELYDSTFCVKQYIILKSGVPGKRVGNLSDMDFLLIINTHKKTSFNYVVCLTILAT